MNLRMGSQIFQDVTIPVLWGTRAVIQDDQGRISVINIGGVEARPEIVGDKPAPKIDFVPTADGFEIQDAGEPCYTYSPVTRTLVGISVNLPPCQIGDTEIRVGSSVFSGNTVSGFGVGLVISEQGMGMGAPVPPGLAKLIV